MQPMTVSPRALTRRRLLATVIASGGALALDACSRSASVQGPVSATASPPPSTSPSGAPGLTPSGAVTATAAPTRTGGGQFSWKRYQGKTIRVLVANQEATSFIERRIKEFEELTGIKVSWEKLPEDQQRQKLTVEFTSGASDIDVFSSHTGQQGAQFMRAGWYEPIKPWVDNPELTAPDYDFADFDANALKQLATVSDTLVGIPDYAITFALYYRKDLLGAAGLSAPTTMDELEAAARQLKRDGTFGITMRGKQAAAVGTWAPFMLNMGGSWLDERGKPNMSSPQNIEAFELYGRLLREYGPPGAINMNWPEAQDIWLQGKAAFFSDTSAFVTNFEDPSKSTVVGKVGYALLPVGKAGTERPGLNGWILSLYAKAPNKEAGWYFIQWASSKQMCVAKQGAGIQQARASAWRSEEFQKGLGAKHPDLVAVLQQAYAKGKADLYPPYVNVAKARDVIGAVIVTAIQGGDVKAAAAQADRDLATLQVVGACACQPESMPR